MNWQPKQDIVGQKMPRKSKEQERFYISNIRKLISIEHSMPLREMQHQLEQNGIHLHVDYINRLREKILRERTHRADRKILSSSLAAFEDILTETTKIAWQIALSNQSTRKERIAALKEIREAQKDIFDKLFDSGVFDRKLGVVEHQPRAAITIEQKAQLIETMISWGIIKPLEDHERLNSPQPADSDYRPG